MNKYNVKVMNNIRKAVYGICILLSTLLMSSCNNDDYLVDGGISNPYFDGNVMQYLESRPDLFEDLVKVIKLNGTISCVMKKLLFLLLQIFLLIKV